MNCSLFKFYHLIWIGIFLCKNKLETKEVEKPFVFVVASFNNRWYVKKNIDSILRQNYQNYRVIYIDDASTDDTLEQVQSIIKHHPKGHKFTVIQNEITIGAMANHYHAIHRCKNEEIVFILDGDDWLSSAESLNILNRYYKDPGVWMTWGSYIEASNKKKGYFSRPLSIRDLKEENFRNIPWQFSHARTFYAWLFKRIKKEDLQINGKFFPIACDLAEIYPMLEMAREKARYVSDTVYVYNNLNPLGDHKKSDEEKIKIIKIILNKPIYKKLNF